MKRSQNAGATGLLLLLIAGAAPPQSVGAQESEVELFALPENGLESPDTAEAFQELIATRADLERRARRARVGLFSSLGIYVAGVALFSGGAETCDDDGFFFVDCNDGLLMTGAAVGAAGIVGLITSGIMLRKRKKRLRRFDSANLASRCPTLAGC